MRIKGGVLGLAILAAVLYISGSVLAVLSGSGTEANPYLIQSRADFEEFANPANAALYWASGKYTTLMCNLDLSGTVYTKAVIAPDTNPISFGFQGTQFNGTFDGNGNVISNLTISALGIDYIGLFGQIGGSGGHIRNLGVENVTIIGNGYVGGLAGMSYGFFTGCHATGLVSGGSNSVGGLTGHCYGSMVGCYATCSVSATNNYVGGLAGFNGGGSMTACYATGAVSGIESVGGLVGSGNSITACYATGSVRGTGSVGGLVGSGNSITACYATGLVSGSSDVGGLVGSSSTGSITACFWDTQTSGQTTSAGGVGKTTAEMQTFSTFNDAGWDFIGENANGLNDYWQMEVNDYPHFSIYTWTLEGEGILANPYVVGTAEDLGKVWRRPWAYYQLGGNLDLSRISWSSAVVPLFTGVFDGQGFVISNLTINQPSSDYMGLFGNTGGSLIRNLGIDHVNITGRNAVGGLVGGNRTTLISCYTTGSVVGIGYVGGLTGLNDNDRGAIIGCYATSSVSGTGNCIGGLVGSNYRGHVIHCYSTGKPTGTSSVGGLVGSNYRGQVIHCYSTGKPTGTSSVGGLCGSVDTGTGYEDAGNFWDTETSEINTGAMGTGKTTAEIMTLSTFTSAGWDFSNTDGDLADWMMLRPGEDTPRLAWQPIFSGDIAGLYGVNIEDLDAFARQWLMGNCSSVNDFCDGADLNKTGVVDLADFSVLAGHWQKDAGFPIPMQGHWTLDDATGTVALDSSGNLRNGTLINGPVWNASGTLNGALQFDGVNDYVSVAGYKGILGTSSRTCAAWIKTPGTAQNVVILGWGGQQWVFGLFGSGELTVYAGGPYIKTVLLVNDNQWHHVAAVMSDDGSPNVSEIKLYVDGLLQTTVNAPGIINTPQANDVLIGAFSAGTPASFFKGLMDDVRIYNTALSDAQIEEIFQTQIE